MLKLQRSNVFLGYFICGLASLFYLYDFLIRVLPGTIVPHLMAQYNLNAASLGLLSSFFYLGYMLMQVPCGLLYDRFGPRRLISITCLMASIATFFFIATNYYSIAIVARFFMGIGSAFAYIGALVLASRWLPHRYFAIVAGLIQLMGSAGAIMGEGPIANFVANKGAFFVTIVVSLIGVGLSILFWLFIRDYPENEQHEFNQNNIKQVLINLKEILHNRQSWATALYGFAIWAPMAIFGELWAVSFLTSLYNFSNTQAASLSSFIWIGVGLGGPFLGWLSNVMESRRKPLLFASTLGIISSLVFLYMPNISVSMMALYLFIFGVAGSAQAVTFGVVQDNNPVTRAGTASGFNNMAIVVGGVLLQPVVGFLLTMHATGNISDVVQIHSVSDYQFALMIIPICFVISLISVLFFIRETNCPTKYRHVEPDEIL